LEASAKLDGMRPNEARGSADVEPLLSDLIPQPPSPALHLIIKFFFVFKRVRITGEGGLLDKPLSWAYPE